MSKNFDNIKSYTEDIEKIIETIHEKAVNQSLTKEEFLNLKKEFKEKNHSIIDLIDKEIDLYKSFL